MESSRGRRAWSGRSMALLCFFAVAISLCYARSWRSWDCSGSGCRGRSSTALPSLDSGRRRAASRANQEGWASRSGRQWRRLLAEGPGSYPPRCASKCGECSPCYPVHVAVPPGVPVTTEYYPEAWRCKCGNRLYMP